MELRMQLILPTAFFFFFIDMVPFTGSRVSWWKQWWPFPTIGLCLDIGSCTWPGALKIILRTIFNLFVWNGNRTESDTEVHGHVWVHWGTDVGTFSLGGRKGHSSFLSMFQWEASMLWGKHMDHIHRSTGKQLWKLHMQKYHRNACYDHYEITLECGFLVHFPSYAIPFIKSLGGIMPAPWSALPQHSTVKALSIPSING